MWISALQDVIWMKYKTLANVNIGKQNAVSCLCTYQGDSGLFKGAHSCWLQPLVLEHKVQFHKVTVETKGTKEEEESSEVTNRSGR